MFRCRYVSFGKRSILVSERIVSEFRSGEKYFKIGIVGFFHEAKVVADKTVLTRFVSLCLGLELVMSFGSNRCCMV